MKRNWCHLSLLRLDLEKANQRLPERGMEISPADCNYGASVTIIPRNRSSRRRTGRIVHGTPYPLGPQRHVDVANAERFERIDHGIYDGRCRADSRRFADALHAKRIEWSGCLGAV